jgi:hypothetical protein
MSNLPVNAVKADNRKCVLVTVVPKLFKISLLPTDSVILDHVVDYISKSRSESFSAKPKD